MNKKILAVALAAAFSAGTANATILIDDFSVNTSDILTAPFTETTTLDASSEFSEFRVLSIAEDPVDADGSVEGGVVGGILGINTGFTNSANTTSFYNNTSGVDLSVAEMGGSIFSAFVLTANSIDQGGVDVTLTVDGKSSTLSASGPLGTPLNLIFAHSTFIGVDFTSVNTISLDIHNNVAVDATFDSLISYGKAPPVGVPEPTSLALLGAGIVAFGFGRRKAK